MSDDGEYRWHDMNNKDMRNNENDAMDAVTNDAKIPRFLLSLTVFA